MALTPWPTDPAELAAARVTLREAIGDPAPGQSLTDGLLDMLGSAASATIEDYAPSAPLALREGACVRFVGYLAGSDFGGVSAESLGPMRLDYVTNHGDAFRRSGAAMLVTRWRVRRVGAI